MFFINDTFVYLHGLQHASVTLSDSALYVRRMMEMLSYWLNIKEEKQNDAF